MLQVLKVQMKVKGHPAVRLIIVEWYGVVFVSKIKSDTHNKYSANQSANRVDWVNRSAIHSFCKSICKQCIVYVLHFDLQLLLTQQIDLHFDLQFDLQVVLSINAFRETKFC